MLSSTPLLFSSLLIFIILTAISCTEEDELQQLPYLGEKEVTADNDTLYHTIPLFAFVNQDSQLVTNETFKDIPYVADFFFTNCPTICPRVKQQMLRIREHFDPDELRFLSHSIDIRHDTVEQLKKYAEKLGIDLPQWHLVTGDREEIYGIADDYFSIVIEDETAPGGYNHSGHLLLVDGEGHIRAFCTGTSPDEVDEFIEKIEILLEENST